MNIKNHSAFAMLFFDSVSWDTKVMSAMNAAHALDVSMETAPNHSSVNVCILLFIPCLIKLLPIIKWSNYYPYLLLNLY